MISFDHPTLSGPKQGLSVDSLFLISFMLKKRQRSREGGRRKIKKNKKNPKRHQSVAVSVDVGHAGVGELDQSPRTSP